MAICTLKAHVSRAMDFFNKDSIYFAIAKPTVWSSFDLGQDYDSNHDYEGFPPVPKNTDELIEIRGFKKVEFRAMVIQDDTGTLEYRNTKWKVVNIADAPDRGARWVYVSSYLNYDELPIDRPYRQVGVFTGLVPKPEVPIGQYVLLPEQVEDMGLLEVIDNRKPVYRDTDVREHIKLILEF